MIKELLGGPAVAGALLSVAAGPASAAPPNCVGDEPTDGRTGAPCGVQLGDAPDSDGVGVAGGGGISDVGNNDPGYGNGGNAGSGNNDPGFGNGGNAGSGNNNPGFGNGGNAGSGNNNPGYGNGGNAGSGNNNPGSSSGGNAGSGSNGPG